MTIYDIYLFLFIIVYIVCFILYLLKLYVNTIKGNNSYKLMVHVKSCRGDPYLTPYKNGIFSC